MEHKSTLIAHVDTAKVTIEQLESIVPPQSTRYWRPVAHIELVNTLKGELSSRSMPTIREDFAVSANGCKLFGTFDLDSELSPGVGVSIGFRHSNDKRIAIQIVGGGRVFVCDNLSLSGDVTVMKQKHTWGYSLKSMIQRGLDFWQRKQVNMIDGIERMQNTPLSDTSAQALLAKALYDGVTTFQTFKLAYDLYFTRAVNQPEAYADCAPRSAWGLHNAYTRALKESTPNAAFSTNIELGKLFKL
jgi:hypothetical protein